MPHRSLDELRERLAAIVGDIDPGSARGKKRLRILESATELFVTHGYRRTNIDDIARAVGVAKGTVYLYFETKAHVLLAALAREKQRLFTTLDDAFDPAAPARERLRRWVKASLWMVAGSPLLSRAVGGDPDILPALVELDPGQVAQANVEQAEFIGLLLDEVARPRQWSDDERCERIAVLAALPRIAPLLRSDPLRQGMSVERFAEVLADMIVDGIGPAARVRA